MFFSKPSGLLFTDRGDLSSYDFAIGDLTVDSNWHDLDLSGVIPKNTKIVFINIYGVVTVAGGNIRFRTKGNSGYHNAGGLYINVAGRGHMIKIPIHPNNNGFIQYNLASGYTYSAMNVAVCMWLK